MNSSLYQKGHSMSLVPLIRQAGRVSVIAAVLIILSQLAGLFMNTSGLPLNEAVKTVPITLYNILKLSGFILLLLGLVGFYARLSSVSGILGSIGFLTAFTGTALVAGDWWFEAFVVPWLADVAPQALEVPPSGTLIAGGVTGFAIFAIGWVLFGIASFRSGVFPRLASTVLILGGALGFQAGYPPFLIVLALAVGWMGYWLQKHGDVLEATQTAEMYLGVER